MSLPIPRTLAGAPDAVQHLAEYTLGPVNHALPPLTAAAGENFLLLHTLPEAAAQARALDRNWTLDAGQLVWLRHAVPVHVRSLGPDPTRLLAWRFNATALAPELAELLLALPPGAQALAGPRPLTAPESTLILGLRACPVAPALRGFWAAAKLVELLTHLLPPPTTRPAAAATKLPPAVRNAIAHMQARLAEPVGLTELAAAAGQSPAHFSRVFSETMGCGPTAHLRRLRMDHAARLLQTGSANVTEAALAVGYQSLGQFSRVFSEHHGRPPSAFLPRRGT